MTTSYDTITYPSNALPQTHPDLLGTLARLHGLDPAPASHCRVLELGGGDGANLVPLAVSYPNSHFVGVDLAESAVARGRAFADALGVPNVELFAADVMELKADFGRFDYIIAHGLFSWVPEAVRARILALCGELLSPHGVAYISYNAYPGFHVRQMLREMLQFHVRDIPDPEQQIAQAQEMLKFLAAGGPGKKGHANFLHEEVKRKLAEDSEALLYHDDLSANNRAFSIRDFAAYAGEHGLQYLCESDFFEGYINHLSPETAGVLRELAQRDELLKEQYLDYLKCRRFRQTLLVRQGLELRRDHAPTLAARFAQATRAKPEGAVDFAPEVPAIFQAVNGSRVTVDLPAAKAGLAIMGEQSPRPIPFAELVTVVCQRLGVSELTAEARAGLCEVLASTFATGMVEWWTEPPHFAMTPGDRPVASRVARWQAARGEEMLTNLLHRPIQVANTLTRYLLTLLDGTRDRAALLDELCAWAATHPAPDGEEPPPDEIRRRLAANLEPGLASVAGLALLEA